MAYRIPGMNYLIKWGNQGPVEPWNPYKLDLIEAAYAFYRAHGGTPVPNAINSLMYQLLMDSYAPPADPPYATEVLADAPIAYWRFEEAAGTIAFESINGNHGAYQLDASEFTPRIPTPLGVGRALTCDGVEDRRVVIPPSSLYDPLALGAQCSVEFWCRISTAPGVSSLLIDLRGGPFAFLALARVETDGSVTITRRNNASSSAVLTLPTMADGAWHHCVFVKAASALFAYKDGAQVDTQPEVGGVFDVPDKIAVGGNAVSSINLYAGMVDEVSFYETGLSAARVAAHFAAA
jgi:hypothetical protein